MNNLCNALHTVADNLRVAKWQGGHSGCGKVTDFGSYPGYPFSMLLQLPNQLRYRCQYNQVEHLIVKPMQSLLPLPLLLLLFL